MIKDVQPENSSHLETGTTCARRRACMCVHLRVETEVDVGVFLKHSPLYFFESGSLMEPTTC